MSFSWHHIFSYSFADLGSSGEQVTVLKTTTYSGNFSGTATKITLNTVSVERGMNWIDAVDIAMSHDGDYDGFYISKPVSSLIMHISLHPS
jgi:hypothetical protein